MLNDCYQVYSITESLSSEIHYWFRLFMMPNVICEKAEKVISKDDVKFMSYHSKN